MKVDLTQIKNALNALADKAKECMEPYALLEMETELELVMDRCREIQDQFISPKIPYGLELAGSFAETAH